MDPSIWAVSGVFVTFLAVLVTFHQLATGRAKRMDEVMDKKIADGAKKCVEEALVPIRQSLAKIESQLHNGLTHASEQHTEAIADLKVDVGKIDTTLNHMASDMSNLSRQIEAALIGKGR